MTEKPVWIYDLTTGLFKRGGHVVDSQFDPQTEGRVELESNPDVALERYDVQTSAVRAATAQEISDALTTRFDELASNAFSGNKVLAAGILALYATVLRRQPTQQEQTALFDTAKTIYKSL